MNPMEERAMNAVRWIVGIFNKHNIRYQIAGGFAAKVYGSPRALNDIDIEILSKDIQTILPDVAGHITFGPLHIKDDKWDCEAVGLNYGGQDIDISAGDTLLMSNKERTEWIPYPDFSFNTLDIEVEGTVLKILKPDKLIAYKKELDGEHQQVDIQAAQEYLTQQKLY